jgi:catalase-peroxidase
VQPIKLKYGIGLSWGDLMVLAGNVAIESMGGPVLGYAAGRMDNIDNSQTISLGPSPEQDKFCPVGTNGDMKFPLGANTMGLIYVNPEGEFAIGLQINSCGVPNDKSSSTHFFLALSFI